jgi:hypothetical protein
MDNVEEQNLVYIRRLEGLELSAVIFIRDYVQFQFGGADIRGYPILTVVTSPQIQTAGDVLAWGNPGFRDAMCEQISRVVTSMTYEPATSVSIGFDSGAILRISLIPELPSSAEALTLAFGNELLVI